MTHAPPHNTCTATQLVEEGGGGANIYDHVVLTRRPLQRGSTGRLLRTPVPRLLSTNADGFHSTGNCRGPTLTNSVISFTGDDLGNICMPMGVYLGVFNRVITMVGTEFLSAATGDHVSFYHLNSMTFLGRRRITAAPYSFSGPTAVAAMRGAFAKLQAPPYSAHFVTSATPKQFSHGLPVALSLDGGMPDDVEPLWSLAVLESHDNTGALIKNSVFSDGYARALMVKSKCIICLCCPTFWNVPLPELRNVSID